MNIALIVSAPTASRGRRDLQLRRCSHCCGPAFWRCRRRGV